MSDTQAELRKEVDIIIGNPLDRKTDTDAVMQLITAHANKQIEAVLDRLDAISKKYGTEWIEQMGNAEIQSAIEAERSKLKDEK